MSLYTSNHAVFCCEKILMGEGGGPGEMVGRMTGYFF